ncbi:hypothetical protein BO83DRAFT_383572 [Aspergillus eucalypticola CBS 122712]|uniref:Uncharacterized protein n=1 Tax=Aspergillus eucalypticola (strain CBS 122712 / IBT 29274) TaxID=1448314 RepID=A0A317UJ89_ASPEC|nr:uncharacterized protein BO83DRAFT_383572 [Aspergillus eucalypticola CBS 122712]PWY62144.1 hypothetical protein BO83DRAFT_383572 [Aspergillus eucalypticola CBS 122712]
MASSPEAQKTKNIPNGSASSTHTTNARRKPLMDFSSLHPCSASMDDEDDEGSMQSSHARVGSFSGMHTDSHSHSHPLSSSSSSASTPTQMQRYTPYQPSNKFNSNYTIPSGSESTPKSTTTAITARLKSKSKSKSTTAHVHFLDQIDISDTTTTTTTSAATSTNMNGNKRTEADGNAAEENTMPLGPRSRDLSLSESEISLLDIGPSLVYGDDGYIPLSAGGYVREHGQGDGGGVSVVGRGMQGLQLE